MHGLNTVDAIERVDNAVQETHGEGEETACAARWVILVTQIHRREIAELIELGLQSWQLIEQIEKVASG